MSNFTQILAISALTLSGAFFGVYFSTRANEVGDQIITGFIRDHPVPVTERWLTLYARWVSYVVGGVATLLLLAFAELMIADHVGHADTQLLAYLAAFLLVVGAVNWLIQGIVQFISYRSLLREAEAR